MPNFMKNRSVQAELFHADGQTDMKKFFFFPPSLTIDSCKILFSV